MEKYTKTEEKLTSFETKISLALHLMLSLYHTSDSKAA